MDFFRPPMRVRTQVWCLCWGSLAKCGFWDQGSFGEKVASPHAAVFLEREHASKSEGRGRGGGQVRQPLSGAQHKNRFCLAHTNYTMLSRVVIKVARPQAIRRVAVAEPIRLYSTSHAERLETRVEVLYLIFETLFLRHINPFHLRIPL
jgi:hypothetical protein